MISRQIDQLFRRWAKHGGGSRRTPVKLGLDAFEDRVVPAVLPSPLVVDTRVVGAGLADVEAVFDPVNADIVVMTGVTTNGQDVQALISTDGGQSFTKFFDNDDDLNINYYQKVVDPGIDSATNRDNRGFTNSSSPSVTFARDGSIYLVHSEHTANKDRGVIVVHKFDASNTRINRQALPTQVDINTGLRAGIYRGITNTPGGPSGSGTPGNGTLGNVIYQWDGDDNPAYNPTIAIDNNLEEFDDPTNGPGIDRTDTMVGKAVYVAYNISTDAKSLPGSPYRRDVIFIQGSSDGGFNFSNPLFVNDAGHFSNGPSSIGPDIEFSPTGELTVGWGSTNGRVQVDTSRPDNGDLATSPVEVFETGSFSGTSITDAGSFQANGQTFDVPAQSITAFQTVSGADLLALGEITDLDARVSAIHTNLAGLRVELEVVVNATGETRRVVLFSNEVAPRNGNFNNPQVGPNGGNDLGIYTYNNNGRIIDIGTVFSDQAGQRLGDDSNEEPFIGQYFPVGGGPTLFPPPATTTYSNTLFGLVNGLTAAELAGGLDFRLIAIDTRDDQPPDNPNPFSRILSWNLKFSGQISNSGFGLDATVTTNALSAGPDNVHPLKPSISPTLGIGPSVTLAYDHSEGLNSPESGNLYVAYAGQALFRGSTFGDQADVYVASRPAGSLGGFFSSRVNDDSPSDHFTEGNRTQFMPSVTVDPLTGTVVAMWYDGRFDAAETRAATYVATSIDGGFSWSDQGYTTNLDYRPYVNEPKIAIDAITGESIFREPFPTLVPNATGFGLGESQAVLAFGGRILPFWTGNSGEAGGGASIFTATAFTAAGPRVVDSTMGPDEDGTISSFVVEFDRPIDGSTFTAADVTVRYLSPTDSRDRLTNPGPTNDIAVASVTQLTPTLFRVNFANPQTAIGTYSYSIGPDIRDFIQRPAGTQPPLTVAFSGPPQFFFDGSAFQYPLTIPDLPVEQISTSVTVQFSINHPRPETLDLFLLGPNATVQGFDDFGNLIITGDYVNLVDLEFGPTGLGSRGANFAGTNVSTLATDDINARNTAGQFRFTAPFSGSFAPRPRTRSRPRGPARNPLCQRSLAGCCPGRRTGSLSPTGSRIPSAGACKTGRSRSTSSRRR